MEDIYNNYNEEKNKVPWLRIILAGLGLIVLIIVIILLVKGCSNKNLQEEVLNAGKSYYETHSKELPKTIGECKTVDLNTLKNENLLKIKKYKDCDNEKTLVSVCYLESGNYHYSSTVSCEDEKTNYNVWKDGNESNLKENSDVRFLFIGKEQTKGTKYYFPNNETSVEKVIEYYKEAPSSEYSLSEGETEGYKWYVEKQVNNYWKDGEYVSIQPDGYPNKGASKTITNISTTKPTTASYRTIKEVTLYRYQKVARPYKYICKSPTMSGTIVSDKPCELSTNGFTEFYNMLYTCDGVNEVSRGTVCAKYTDWSTNACEDSIKDGIDCDLKSGYQYTDTMWKWYKKTTVKNYYPSNSTDASKEKTYYIESPLKNAIKDESTKAIVSRYYKLVEDTENTNYEEWKNINENYVTETELIKIFQDLKYDVKELNDINKIDKIKYEYKMQYRDIEE